MCLFGDPYARLSGSRPPRHSSSKFSSTLRRFAVRAPSRVQYFLTSTIIYCLQETMKPGGTERGRGKVKSN